MNPVAIIALVLSVGLAVMVFRLAIGGFGWHWAVGVLLASVPVVATFFFGIVGLLVAAVPVVATFFFGIVGLLGGALFVGAMYKASG